MSKTTNITPKKKRRVPALFQLLLIVGFLALIWFSFGQNVLTPQKQAVVPERLGTLELVGSFEGSEAIEQISKLHGTDISLVDAYTAVYIHSNQRVTVWVGRAESLDAAAELTRSMIDGIERGGSGFNNLQGLDIAGHEVFRVDGPSGEHFFYHSWELAESVVWLSIEASDTMPILEQAIKTF